MSLENKRKQWRLYLIYKCIYEMLIDRKYTNIDSVPTFDNFTSYFCKDNQVPSYSSLTFVANNTLVYFLDDESVGIKHMMKLYEILKSKNIKHCIFVHSQVVTFSAKKFVTSKSKEIQIEYFCQDELLINKTRHVYSPKYNISNATEVKSFGINDYEKLPKILSNDHISKYFGLKRGDILKITRQSETIGEYTTFRICV